MKIFFIAILERLGQLFAILYPQTLTNGLKSIRNRAYTGYLRHEFKHLGNSVIMWHPYTLIGGEYMEIGEESVIEPDIQLTARKLNDESPLIHIGNHCLIRRGAHITAIHKIEIGDNVLTGTNILITDNSHGDTNIETLKIPATLRTPVSKGCVTIKDNVWIGNNVCIMPNVTIGTGAVIGANSVVTHDIPPFSVAAGIPAKVIKSFQNTKTE